MAEETINPIHTTYWIKYEVFIRFIKSIQCELNLHFEVNTVENIFLLLSKKIICHFCIVHLLAAWLKMFAFINNDFKNDFCSLMISSWLAEWNRKCYFKLKGRCFYLLTKNYLLNWYSKLYVSGTIYYWLKNCHH